MFLNSSARLIDAGRRGPGRWQRLAGTSACTAVRGRSVLRCSGRAKSPGSG